METQSELKNFGAKYPLTYDGQGYIYYNGKNVEHYSSHRMPVSEMIKAPEYGVNLLKKCAHIEKLGLIPDSQNVCWNWDWFAAIESPDSPYLEIISNIGAIWEKEGSVIIAHNEVYLLFKEGKNGCSVEGMPEEVISGDKIAYHYFESLGYTYAKIGQRENLGQIYAPLTGLIDYLKRKNIPLNLYSVFSV